jgi:hypothetical protein
MAKYIVKFNLGTLPCTFAESDSSNDFTKETNSEVLKEYASMLIKAFREIYIDGMKDTPTSIELLRDDKCILQCDDLTGNSINRTN